DDVRDDGGGVRHRYPDRAVRRGGRRDDGHAVPGGDDRTGHRRRGEQPDGERGLHRGRVRALPRRAARGVAAVSARLTDLQPWLYPWAAALVRAAQSYGGSLSSVRRSYSEQLQLYEN